MPLISIHRWRFRSGRLAGRYTENIDALIAPAKPRERDELRRAFYGGGTDDIDDDPEAPKQRTVRKKA